MIAIITARRGSRRCPDKNIRPFNEDKNLVLRTRDQAEWLKPWKIIITADYNMSEIGISIDIPAIMGAPIIDMTKNSILGGPPDKIRRFTYHKRPEELALDDTTSEDVIKDVLDCMYCGEYYDENAGDDHEGDIVPANLHDQSYFVLLQPTSPIRSEETLTRAQARFEKGDIPALVSVNPALQPNGSFYFCRTDVFLAEHTLYPKGTHFWVCSWEESVDINYPYEFRIAEAVARGDVHGR